MPLSSYRISLDVKSRRHDFAYLFSAFDNEDTLTFSLTLSRQLGAFSPVLELYDADEHAQRLTFAFSWQSTDYDTELYTLQLPLRKLKGLYYASCIFESCEGMLRLSYDPMHYTYRAARADEAYEPVGFTVYEASYETPDWFSGGILYQIFVDRFYRGSVAVPCREDACLDPDWENGIPQYPPYRGAPFSNNTFFGGTLYGVAEKMDYLQSLGVTAIYLSPIFSAFSNHKYDTADYLKIDEMFGGEAGFRAMLDAAASRGIRVILDGVFNHTGDNSRYFNKYGKFDTLGAYQSKESPYYTWYEFERFPDRYRSWWGIDILPAVNTDHPDYRQFICGEDGVIRRYLKAGISGWRLDVADELSEDFITCLRRAAREEKRDALILGEVWEDASNKVAYGALRRYFWGSELDGVMNYPVGNAIIDYLLSGDAAPLFATLKRLYAHYPKAASDVNMNLLGTHDTERILNRLSGVGENGRSEEELAHATLPAEARAIAKARLRLAWFLLSTVPGVPTVFYGDEAGMEGYHDPFNRRPYPWGREDGEILSFYREINAMRREIPLFKKGYFALIEDMPAGVLAYARFDTDALAVMIVNRSDKAVTLPLSSLIPRGCESLSGKIPRDYFAKRTAGDKITVKSHDFSLILW